VGESALLDVHEDSKAVAKPLRKQAEAGIDEAVAPKPQS
jgi:hypothetical protein